VVKFSPKSHAFATLVFIRQPRITPSQGLVLAKLNQDCYSMFPHNTEYQKETVKNKWYERNHFDSQSEGNESSNERGELGNDAYNLFIESCSLSAVCVGIVLSRMKHLCQDEKNDQRVLLQNHSPRLDQF
jgi:hypothetical protein